MNILIALKSVIPALKYGGIERAVWYLGKELSKSGHQVTFLAAPGSYCDFANIIPFETGKRLNDHIPDDIDIIQFEFIPEEEVNKPYVVNLQINSPADAILDLNTIFVSKNHANRYGSESYVYNGMDWDDYGKPDFVSRRNYFHFLGKAAWRVKNVKGAIHTVQHLKGEKLKVLGGTRLNIKMGFRLTLDPNIRFYGMVGGEQKYNLLKRSKGLIFPVRWHEPFGIAITESLYFGCPVFGTPYGSLPELVPNELGHLSSNLVDLAEAVRNVDSYSREKCHEYARDVHNSSVMADAYLVKYEKVLNGEKLNLTPPKLVALQEEKFLPWS
ncbi:MAG: glycosyltransferase [Cyclobacteriaceae bacterium]